MVVVGECKLSPAMHRRCIYAVNKVWQNVVDILGEHQHTYGCWVGLCSAWKWFLLLSIPLCKYMYYPVVGYCVDRLAPSVCWYALIT